jgi:hypothetical protein
VVARLLVNYDLALLLLAARGILAERHGRSSLGFREGADRAAKFLATLTIYYAEMHWRDKRVDGRSMVALVILRLFSRKFRRARRLLGEAGLDPSLLDAQYERQLELERIVLTPTLTLAQCCSGKTGTATNAAADQTSPTACRWPQEIRLSTG